MLKQSIFVLFAAVSIQSTAAELTIDKPISVLALNGVKFDENQVDLQPGTHQLVARYSHQLPNSGNKKKRIQSDVKVFHIEVKQEEAIRLIAPKFNRYSQAEYAFNNDQIEWRVQDQSGEDVNYTIDFMPGRSGLLPYSDIERVVEDFNKSNNIIVDERSGVLASTSLIKSAKPESELSSTNALEASKAHYLQLNEKDKKAFRKWLVDIN